MKIMKKASFLISSLLLILFLTACASNKVEADIANPNVNVSSNTKNQQTSKRLRFDDWKYMGFGYKLPKWFEAALDENISKVKKSDSILSNSEIRIFVGQGDNVDQADSLAKEAYAQAKEEGLEGYKLYDYYWARIADVVEFPYKSVYIYYKDTD